MAESNPIPDAASAADPADSMVGKVLNGRFTVLERIGSGGMGRVYKAMQSPLDRVCALKVLNPTYQVEQDPAFAKRFFLEASVTSKLTHPNTITIFDYGRTDDGVFFIAMEYLQGRTLHAAIAAEGSLTPPRAIHIARQICRALREAHGLGIVHRDLKPANVMLLHHGDDEDFVKVLDFGLVKFFTEQPDRSPDEVELTQGGVFLGSPTYMAPEQARNHADPRSDVYSLGVVLYHMLAGKPPFQGRAPVDIILKHVNEPPPPFRPELKIPGDLEAVVLRSLSKVPEERFQTMDEFLEALKRVGTLSPSDIIYSSGAMSKPNALPPPVPTRPGTNPGRTGPRPAQPQPLHLDDPPEVTEKGRPPWLMPAVGGGLLLLLGAGAVVALSSKKAPPPEPPAPVAAKTPEPTPADLKGPTTATSAAPTGKRPLSVTGSPAGAEVRLGEAVVGKVPFTMALDPTQLPSPLHLTFSAPGYESAEVEIVAEGEGLRASADLKKLEAHQAPTPQPEAKHPTIKNNGKKPAQPTKPSGYKDDPY